MNWVSSVSAYSGLYAMHWCTLFIHTVGLGAWLGCHLGESTLDVVVLEPFEEL